MRRSVDADKLMDGLGRLATDTDLCKRYGNCTPWIPYSAVRKLISDMILEAKESCDDTVSRKAMLEKIRTMQTYKLFSGDDMILVDKAQVQTELMMLPSVQPDLDEWCTDCKEYDSNKHCCPRFSRVIREALKEAQPKVIVLCADCIKRDKCKFYDTQGDGGYCRYGRDKDGRFNPQTDGD